MASPLLRVSGTSGEAECMRSDISVSSTCALDFAAEISNPRINLHQWKSINLNSFSSEILREIKASLPTLLKPEYYMEPCFDELVQRELMDPGYCSRVPDFTIGRYAYGSVKYIGETDVRWLDLDDIVTFHRHEIVVYEDESAKRSVGRGLNKTAEVTLVLRLTSAKVGDGQKEIIVDKLRQSMARQGAQFVSFDLKNGEWKFLVHHFSRFGFSEDNEEDIIMDHAPAAQELTEVNGDEVLDVDEGAELDHSGSLLSLSLPAHLSLDPIKMNEIRMLMF